jgi:hypothetical protein
VVFDKYGMDINVDANAEADIFKAEAKGEVRSSSHFDFSGSPGPAWTD